MIKKGIKKDEKMEYKVTTITAVVDISFIINIEKLIYFIPVNRGMKKIEEGDIISLRYTSRHIRGILDIKNNPFRNSITLSIVFNKKIISVKLFRKKLQICGIDTDEAIKFCVEKIINHIREIIKCKVNEINLYTINFLNNFNENLSLRDKIKIMNEYKNTIVMNNNSEKLEYKVNKVMINHKYDLNFSISKTHIIRLLKDNKNFLVIPQSIADFYIYVMVFDDNKNFICYLIIYKSGKITQSGKDEKRMEENFRKFYKLLLDNKDIISVNLKRKIYYRPYYPIKLQTELI